MHLGCSIRRAVGCRLSRGSRSARRIYSPQSLITTYVIKRNYCYLHEKSMPLQDVLKPLREAPSPAAEEVHKLLKELESKGLESCEVLNLENRGWKEEHAHWLSAILLRLPNLRELSLEGNPIGPEGARAIARAIRGHPKLEVLDLEDCKIGRIGARSIISAIQPPKTPVGPRSNVIQHTRSPVPIRVLDLEGNLIDDSLSELIGRFIRQNTTTLELDLEDNQLGDKCAEEIARALSYNRTLKELDLSGNIITSAGMAFVTKFFASRSVVAPVEDLNLSSNKIDASTFEDFIKKSLKINPFLKKIDLSGNVGEIPESLMKVMNDYLERNRNPEAKTAEKESESTKDGDAPKKPKRSSKKEKKKDNSTSEGAVAADSTKEKSAPEPAPQ